MWFSFLIINCVYAGSLLEGFDYVGQALFGVLALLANGVTVNMGFSYWRKGCNLRNWRFVVLVLLAISPFVPIPIDIELMMFLAPFFSFLIAGVAALIKGFSPIDDSYDLWMYDYSGNFARALALAGISFGVIVLSVCLSVISFTGVEYDDLGLALLATLLALPYAFLVFRNVRAVSVWSASYMIQLVVMIALPALSLLVLVLQNE